jgi:hypothetical protein
VALQPGGKNPLIVMEDADLAAAASNAVWGAYLHKGQICMATRKILAHASIAAKLTELLVEKANYLPVGNPATERVALGPVLNQVRDRERRWRRSFFAVRWRSCAGPRPDEFCHGRPSQGKPPGRGSQMTGRLHDLQRFQIIAQVADPERLYVIPSTS